MTMSRTVLVTGAAGFIGSHVVQQLLRRGDTVVGLDNFDSYYDLGRKQSNLRELEPDTAGGRFTLVQGDIRDRPLLGQLFEQHKITEIAHLAGMPGVRASVDSPHLYYDVNLIGTLNLIEEARRCQVRNFVFASTSSVYGNTQQIPFIETDICDRPLAPYPASKRSAELLGYTYHHLYGLNFTAARFFTVYGPRCRPDLMVYKVADNISFNKEVPLFNGGQMYRDWTYVDDIVAGVVAAVDRPLGFEIINLGRGEPVLLADFVQLIEELAGRKARLIPAPMPDTDMARTYADVSKAQRLLGYQPNVSVRTGVERFWKWYEQAVLGKPGA
jgi:UDP-glucuronate 4-epimerase